MSDSHLGPTGGNLRQFLTYAGAAFIAAPVGIVAHECAHLLAAFIVGADGLQLHHASMTTLHEQEYWTTYANDGRAFAGTILPHWQPGIVALAGPVASWGIAIVACVFMMRIHNRPVVRALAAAFATTACIRSMFGVPYVAIKLLRPGSNPFPSFDEFHAGVALGFPTTVFVFVGVAIFVYSIVLFIRTHRPSWKIPSAGLVSGFITGMACWMAVGPQLLP